MSKEDQQTKLTKLPTLPEEMRTLLTEVVAHLRENGTQLCQTWTEHIIQEKLIEEERPMSKEDQQTKLTKLPTLPEEMRTLLTEVVAHLRENGTQLCQTWTEHIIQEKLIEEERPMSKEDQQTKLTKLPTLPEEIDPLLSEVVEHLRENRIQLCPTWAERIIQGGLLTAMSEEEIFAETTTIYDNYVRVLETGSTEALQVYASDLFERVIPRGVEIHEVLGIVLLLRDVLARSLLQKYRQDFELLDRVLDAYEPAANRIASTVGVSIVEELERVIRQQKEDLCELSTHILFEYGKDIDGALTLVERCLRNGSTPDSIN